MNDRKDLEVGTLLPKIIPVTKKSQKTRKVSEFGGRSTKFGFCSKFDRKSLKSFKQGSDVI